MKRAVPRSQSVSTPQEAKTQKLFVGGLLTSTNEEHIREAFSSYGKVSTVHYKIYLKSRVVRIRSPALTSCETKMAVLVDSRSLSLMSSNPLTGLSRNDTSASTERKRNASELNHLAA